MILGDQRPTGRGEEHGVDPAVLFHGSQGAGHVSAPLAGPADPFFSGLVARGNVQAHQTTDPHTRGEEQEHYQALECRSGFLQNGADLLRLEGMYGFLLHAAAPGCGEAAPLLHDGPHPVLETSLMRMRPLLPLGIGTTQTAESTGASPCMRR